MSSRKYKDGFFIQVSREIFKSDLPHQSILIYTVLTELEHRFTYANGKDDFFFHSLKEVAKECRMNPATVIKYRKLLIDDGWISTWQMHWIDKETKRKSEKKITAYKMLR